MNDLAIKVESLGKRYQIRHQPPHDSVKEMMMGVWNKVKRKASRSTTESFWALRDVSFELRRGEILGVVGRNGAGKSTLLKILARITKPTEGKVAVYQRVASLLEVGTGFHPELSGRENIFMNGIMLGMKQAEVKKRFDEIVAFSEIERFLDTPVKHYSSGMYMRLAFAVAAHLESEILIVDEVLAVGDATFQQKCLRKIDALSHAQDRSVIFISHDTESVRRLCTRAIYLQQGSVVAMGKTEQVLQVYFAA